MNFVLAGGAAALAWSMYQYNTKTAHVEAHSEKHSLFNTVMGPWWEHANEDLSVSGGSHTDAHVNMQRRNKQLSTDHPAVELAHQAITGVESQVKKVDTLYPGTNTVYSTTM